MPKKTTKKSAKKTSQSGATRAGRPKGSGKFGCATKAVRVPTHLEDDIQLFIRRKLKTSGKAVK
ncbi:MAG: hypothetical protein LBG58_01785 [Planctomycetaceae bacterium]|jgi:hypothetical protein|nr:hypothetical protein [Planctomycetaceae bacterium]